MLFRPTYVSSRTLRAVSIVVRFIHRPYYASNFSQTSAGTLEEFYASLLHKCAKTSALNHGRAIHANFIKGFLSFSVFLCNHILNVYVKCGDLAYGLKLFEEMPVKNVVSWSAVIAGFVQNGQSDEALSLFGCMHRDGTTMPNEFTLISALQACSLSESLFHTYQVYAFIVRLGFESNIFLMNALLTALIRHGKVAEALKVFDKSFCKDVVSWNAMIAGYLQFCHLDQLPRFWHRMNVEGVKPDNYTFSSVLTGLAALSDLKMGIQVHGAVVKRGYGGDDCVGKSLADLYMKNHKLMDGFKAFQEMASKDTDVCSWTQMAAGCLHCGEPSKALQVISLMRKEMGLRPNKFTLATALNACSNLASLDEGKKIHALRIKLELAEMEMDVCVDNALIDMYAKCGCMNDARNVFELMKDRSVVTWTTMIMGCALNGEAREALEIFEKMRVEGVEPNDITFICILYACSEGGFVEEGWMYLRSMTSEYGITPLEEHYTCMVNLLGRVGRIKEAEELIIGMSCEQPASAMIWQTLGSACQLHGDMETGKRAAERAIELDKKDASTYVLLSNMLAGTSNWDSVGMLREVMESRDVKKSAPGSSWI